MKTMAKKITEMNVADAVRKIDQDWLIKNAIKLAKHHKKYCIGEKCDIALFGIAELFNRANIKLTKKQRGVFL